MSQRASLNILIRVFVHLYRTTTRIGDLDLNNDIVDGASPVDIAVEEIIPHPEYSVNPIVNDIALIRLKSPVTFTSKFSTLFLQSNGKLHLSDN